VPSAKPERRIVSIAAAPGWGALVDETGDEDDEDDEDYYHYAEPRLVTLAAWALVEEAAGQTRLVGLVQKPDDDGEPSGDFLFADEVDGFAGYSNQGLKTRPAE
jgi:hypothetical protein